MDYRKWIVALVAGALMANCGAKKDTGNGDGEGDGTEDTAGDMTSDTSSDTPADIPSDVPVDSHVDTATDTPTDLPPGTSSLTGIIRDFMSSHPDFEDGLGTETGIVADDLGDDGKPVYAGGDGTATTHGEDAFDQWYNDVDGVNMSTPHTIILTSDDGEIYTYDNPEFFPIDGELFGNEDNPHNYHFTLEIHTEFQYRGGEEFTFRGDDDLFVFVNGKLALDLGGVHGPISGTVDFDAQAADLGITIGNTYTFDFFFAERHTTQSNFRIETNIEEFIII